LGARKTNKLVREAGKVLEENSIAIAVSLAEHAKQGHIQSTKLLLDLADRSTEDEGEERSRPLRDWAGEVAAEPEWQGEMSEEAAETGAGGREPEG
jgi:hypothetical protein